MALLDYTYLYREYVELQKSLHEIAALNATYAVKVMRALKKHGIQLRGKSEAQVIALKKGRSPHPTKGKQRSETTKQKISATIKENHSGRKEN